MLLTGGWCCKAQAQKACKKGIAIGLGTISGAKESKYWGMDVSGSFLMGCGNRVEASYTRFFPDPTTRRVHEINLTYQHRLIGKGPVSLYGNIGLISSNRKFDETEEEAFLPMRPWNWRHGAQIGMGVAFKPVNVPAELFVEMRRTTLEDRHDRVMMGVNFFLPQKK